MLPTRLRLPPTRGKAPQENRRRRWGRGGGRGGGWGGGGGGEGTRRREGRWGKGAERERDRCGGEQGERCGCVTKFFYNEQHTDCGFGPRDTNCRYELKRGLHFPTAKYAWCQFISPVCDCVGFNRSVRWPAIAASYSILARHDYKLWIWIYDWAYILLDTLIFIGKCMHRHKSDPQSVAASSQNRIV